MEFPNSTRRHFLRNIEPKPFLNCHDVCLDAEGNLYVAHWASKKTHPYKLEAVV